jgi:hypothetical protein
MIALHLACVRKAREARIAANFEMNETFGFISTPGGRRHHSYAGAPRWERSHPLTLQSARKMSVRSDRQVRRHLRRCWARPPRRQQRPPVAGAAISDWDSQRPCLRRALRGANSEKQRRRLICSAICWTSSAPACTHAHLAGYRVRWSVDPPLPQAGREDKRHQPMHRKRAGRTRTTLQGG